MSITKPNLITPKPNLITPKPNLIITKPEAYLELSPVLVAIVIQHTKLNYQLAH